MNPENLKSLLELGRKYLEGSDRCRWADEVLSDWAFRLAKKTEWPHLDALTYWKTYGLKEIRWDLMSCLRRRTAQRENTDEPAVDLRLIPEEDRETPDEPEYDFPAWRERLKPMMGQLTKCERAAIETCLANGEVKGPPQMSRLRGIRRLRERLHAG